MIKVHEKSLIPAYRLHGAKICFFFLLILCLNAARTDAAVLPHHDISVTLDPARHSIRAVDRITLPEHFARTFTFALHAGLSPASANPNIALRKTSSGQAGVHVELFEVSLPEGTNTVTVQYGGIIDHPISTGTSQAGGIDQTPGSITREGVYLASSSAWYPLLETDFLTFSLSISLPQRWNAVSQGVRVPDQRTGAAVRWDSLKPQTEIYLIASRFTLTEKTRGNLTAQVYLRDPDAGLAAKYLEATFLYIQLYSSLIGPYPYGKFALVENFWESGFGMPSFTLLGPTVIRLPFIINTSYPHEILHNWFGNSVHPDYGKGNWSEGLTAYLADHLFKEQQGAGADYRLNTLQKYTDYVRKARDFPLALFTARHSPATEAVGYGKSLMFFHMLRHELGDEAFIDGIRHFYRNYRFQFAAFSALRKSFESVSGTDLGKEFRQWVERTGAPEIKLLRIKTREEGRGEKKEFVVAGRLKQVQQGEPYRLRVPIAVTMDGEEKAFQTIVELNEPEQEFSITVPSPPIRIDVDPEFDLFRRLDRYEVPPAITQALGASRMLVLLPSRSDRKLRAAYKIFAQTLADSGPDEVEVRLDSEVRELPRNSAVVLLGWENLFLGKMLPGLKAYRTTVSKDSFRIGQSGYAKENTAFILTARSPADSSMPMMAVAADSAEQLPGLARKLPHYHKYSYLVFKGDKPENIAKGRWPVFDSPLTVFLKRENRSASDVPMGALRPRDALAELPPVFQESRRPGASRDFASGGNAVPLSGDPRPTAAKSGFSCYSTITTPCTLGAQ